MQDNDAKAPKPRRRWRRRMWKGFAILAALLAAAYMLLTGPRDFSRYPPRESSPYRLPWTAGITCFCNQSNRGIVSHRGIEEFAFDFSMDEGSIVCAARAGVVTHLDVSHDGHGWDKPNNYIVVDHGDGTSASYAHLRKGGSLVKKDDRVAQGQRIGLSGHVGKSLAPHLHFHVQDYRRGVTIPVSFSDVPAHRGVPRMGFRYTSGNTAPVIDAAPTR